MGDPLPRPLGTRPRASGDSSTSGHTELSCQKSPSSGGHPASAFLIGDVGGLARVFTTDRQSVPVLNPVSTIRARGRSAGSCCVRPEASPFLNQTESPGPERAARTQRAERERQTLLWSTHNGTDGDASGLVDCPCPRQTNNLPRSLAPDTGSEVAGPPLTRDEHVS